MPLKLMKLFYQRIQKIMMQFKNYLNFKIKFNKYRRHLNIMTNYWLLIEKINLSMQKKPNYYKNKTNLNWLLNVATNY